MEPTDLRNLKGASGFERYYAHLFGDEYNQFKDSLQADTHPAFRTCSSTTSKLERAWKKSGYSWNPVTWNSDAIQWPAEAEKGTPLPGVDKALLYPMNASSLLPVMALDPQPGDTVLDACAAPGGKALYIADRLAANGSSETLYANDTSPKRRARLQQALIDYRHPQVQVLGTKAETLFKKFPDTFDRILVDAPCSSEKHVFNSPRHLEQWTYNRIKSLAQRQIAILSGLFLALTPGGRMVYATCAANTEENEGVVGRLLAKKKQDIRLVPFAEVVPNAYTLPGRPGMAGQYKADFDLTAVRRILPHQETESNLDPMFVAVFERL